MAAVRLHVRIITLAPDGIAGDACEHSHKESWGGTRQYHVVYRRSSAIGVHTQKRETSLRNRETVVILKHHGERAEEEIQNAQ